MTAVILTDADKAAGLARVLRRLRAERFRLSGRADSMATYGGRLHDHEVEARAEVDALDRMIAAVDGDTARKVVA